MTSIEKTSSTSQELLARARQLFGDGQSGEAERICQSMLAEESEHIEAVQLLAAVWSRTDRVDDAIELLSRFPDSAVIGVTTGDILRHLGRIDEALDAYREAFRRDRDSFPIAIHVASVYQEVGRFDDAIAAYQHVIGLNVKNALAFHNLGVIYQEQGDVENALAAYQKAIELQPDSSDTYFNLGNLCRDEGNLDAAVSMYLEAVRLQPNYLAALHNLGTVYHQQERWAEAEAMYERALTIDPADADVHFHLGYLYQQQEQYPEAEAAFLNVRALQPAYPLLDRMLGTVQAELDDPVEAERSFQLALALEPDNVWLYESLAAQQLAQKNHSAAVESLRSALALEPDRPVLLRELAEALYALGRIDEAKATYEQWLTADPDDPMAQHLVASRTGRGVPDRASDEYVQRLFDGSAESFDDHLGRLAYKGPQLLAEALLNFFPAPAQQWDVLDAGCGTGLCGPKLRPYARSLVGMDLSTRMLEEARKREIYDRLVPGELTAYLADHPAEFDFLVAADVVPYFGRLEPLFEACAQALRENGHLFLALESAGDVDLPLGYQLHAHARYCHTPAYVQKTLQEAGFSMVSIESDMLRMHREMPVEALVVVAAKTSR